MERIEVERLNKDRLSRNLWVFRWFSARLVLQSYHEEIRETPRHKFKGPKWDSADERNYNSKLARPTEIPAEIMMDAIAKVSHSNFHFYIGWTNDESYHATKHATDY